MALFAFVVAAGWRLVTYNGLSNDHYVHLARAQQVLLGALPVRDFVDPGMPLTYGVSALARLALGETQLSEVLLVVTGFAAGAALTGFCAASLSSSIALSVFVVLLEVLSYPRSYSYPKILLYALGACVVVAVARRPTPTRIMLGAVTAAIAFLFRHDHGLYIGVAMAAGIALRLLPDWRASLRAVARFGGLAALLLVPWAAFVQYYEGLLQYFGSAVEFSRREAYVSSLNAFPRFSASAPLYSAANTEAWLTWLFVGVPIVALLAAAGRSVRRLERWPGESAAVAGLAVMALLADRGFLRDPIGMRLPDAVVLPLLLLAWLVAAAWTVRSRWAAALVARAAAVAVLLLTAAAIWRVGDVTERLDGAGFFHGPASFIENVRAVQSELNKRQAQALQTPSRVSAELAPLFDYLTSCSRDTDRLLVTGQYPDVYLAAGRGFAGGHVAFMQGFYTSRREQERTLARLQRESVPFVLLVRDVQPVFEHDFPLLNAYIARSYTQLLDVPIPEMDGVRLLVDRQRRPTGTYAGTNWPCFR